jgi:hypothetical protein
MASIWQFWVMLAIFIGVPAVYGWPGLMYLGCYLVGPLVLLFIVLSARKNYGTSGNLGHLYFAMTLIIGQFFGFLAAVAHDFFS